MMLPPTVPVHPADGASEEEMLAYEAACARYLDWLTGVPSALNAVVPQ